MKIATVLTPEVFGSLGALYVWDGFANKEEIPIPSTVNTVNTRPDFVPYRRGTFSRTVILGGHTDNLVFTEQKALVKMSINAPTTPIVTPGPAVENQVSVAVAAGPGLTGDVSVAYRFLDSKHFRRSPLSAASPVIPGMTNDGLTIAGLPTGPIPADPWVDKIEFYVSVDGGLYRSYATRDIGASTVTLNETGTGEAYNQELIPMPKVAFGDVMHERAFYAGNPTHPDRVYVTILGNTEEYAGIFIPTRNGDAVTAIKNIDGDTLYVQCRNSAYYIRGFSESDLTMKRFKRKLGGFGQHNVVVYDDTGFVITPSGWFLTDGTAYKAIGGGEWDATWRRCVKNATNKPIYERGFLVADEVSGVVKFYAPNTDVEQVVVPDIIGFPRDGTNNVWVVNAAGLIPNLAGPGTADLSYDIHNGATITCAAMLYDPGQTTGILYSGTVDGDILEENVVRAVDKAEDESIPITFIRHSHHAVIGPVANGDEDSFKAEDVWLDFQCENLESEVGIYAGNEFAWQAGLPDSQEYGAPESFDIPPGAEGPGPLATAQNFKVPRDRIYLPSTARSSGTCISTRLTVTQSSDTDNPSQLGFNHQRAEVAYYGWGYIANAGTENRPIQPHIPD